MINRYSRTPVLAFGQKYGTSLAILAIRENIKNNNIKYTDYISKENERLDILAGQFYGDGKLWWILAAASNIAYGCQLTPGTIIRIPLLSDIEKYIG